MRSHRKISDIGQEVVESSNPKTIKEMFGLGIPQKCTYEGGVVYVADGKMRGDFSSTDEEGVTTESHMIVDGNTSYVWVEGQDMGYMTTFDADQTETTDSGDYDTVEVMDPVQPHDYVCEGWVANSEVFVLPSNIVFKDINSLLPTNIPMEESMEGSDQCSYCNALSGDQKTQCLSAMNCE